MQNRPWDDARRCWALPSAAQRQHRIAAAQRVAPAELCWGWLSCGGRDRPGGAGSILRATLLPGKDAKPNCPAWNPEIPRRKRFQDGHKNDRRALPKRALRHTASILYSPVRFALRTLPLR